MSTSPLLRVRRGSHATSSLCAAWVALALCGGCKAGERGYCIAEVRAEDQDQGVSDPGFYNADLVGTTVCVTDAVTHAFCKERDGTFGSVDDYENGAEPFCAEHGFEVACTNMAMVESEDDCPAES